MKGLIGFSRRVLVVYGVPLAGIFILTRFDMDEDLQIALTPAVFAASMYGFQFITKIWGNWGRGEKD